MNVIIDFFELFKDKIWLGSDHFNIIVVMNNH